MAQEAMQKSRIILWFRDDLRLHDNPTVHAAVKRIKSKQASEVQNIYSPLLLSFSIVKSFGIILPAPSYDTCCRSSHYIVLTHAILAPHLMEAKRPATTEPSSF